MSSTPSEIVTDLSPMQSLNALIPMFFTLGGIFTEVKPLQPSKAPRPISITPSGIVTDLSPMQSLNASSPMFFTLGGIFTEVKP